MLDLSHSITDSIVYSLMTEFIKQCVFVCVCVKVPISPSIQETQKRKEDPVEFTLQ